MFSIVAWLPALFSALVAFFRSPERAFLAVFIPVLLLLPQIFYSQIEGFPDLNFSETCLIPIFIAFLFFRTAYWKFSLMDGAILAFIGGSFYSEWRAADAGYAINQLATQLCNTLAPYVLAKQLIHPLGLSEKLAKRIVFLMFINVLLSFWEIRFISVPQIALFQPLFPETTDAWPVLFRYGLPRIRGPFVQAILFGVGLTIAILLNYWLIKTKKWSPNFRYLPPLCLRKGMILMLFLCFGLLMTFSRGPWISCLLGLVLAGAGFSQQRRISFWLRGSLIAFILFLLFLLYSPYTDVNRYLVKSETEANIAYRAEIYQKYSALAFQEPVWGWGTREQPLLEGIRSIDNQYLLLFLQKGWVGLSLYVGMIGWTLSRLMRRGVCADGHLSFTLMSVLFAMALSFVTVYMGMQTEMLFFMTLGWAEGLLQTKVAKPMEVA